MNIFKNLYKFLFVFVVVALSACGEYTPEQTSGEESSDPVDETQYSFEISEQTAQLIATWPDDVESDELTFTWFIEEQVVGSSATFDMSTSGYSGKQDVLLIISHDGVDYTQEYNVDFDLTSTNQAPIASFSFADNILTATSTDDEDVNQLTHQWYAANQLLGIGTTWDTTNLSGLLTIKLVSIDAEGLSDSSEQSIDFASPINTPPNAIASANVTSGLTPLLVSFDASLSTDDQDSSLSYYWDFGDGSSSNLAKPNKVFNSAGHYSVSLTVTDSESLSSTAETIIITALSASTDLSPIAVISKSVSSGTAPLTVSFSANQSSDDNEISAYLWDFDDGSAVVSGDSVNHTFYNEGSYNVTLTVTDNAGQSSQASTTITVAEDEFPVALFTTSTNTGNAPFTVTFDATGSSDDNGIAAYSWNFGDGSATASGEIVEHTYDEQGDYNVVLTVTDTKGQISQVSTQITVQTADDLAPVASFTTSATTGEAPLDISFDAASSSDDNGIVSYNWDFGDGSAIVTGVSVSHRFENAGDYVVTLTVTDAAGQSSQQTKQISIQAIEDLAPVASFTTTASSGEAPLVVSFDASSSSDDNEIVSYSWDFGDGSALVSGVTATHSYTVAGNYTATLTVTDASNQTDSTTQIFTVSETVLPPVANFSISVSELSVTVDASDSYDPEGGSLSYLWTFKDADDNLLHSASGVTYLYDFASAGVKYISLVVGSGDLSSETLTKSLTLQSDGQTEPGNGDGIIIFSEDYEQQTVGQNPAGWGVNIAYNIQMDPSATAYADKVRVVDDAPGRDGKALYVDGRGLNSSQNYSIMPLDLSVVDNVERVYVRYYIYATTNYIGNRALTPSGAQPNHNHFMSLGLSHSAEMRIGEVKGALGANEYGGDDIVPKEEYWYGQIETARMDAGTWYCVETAFINDGESPVLRTWLDEVLITEVDEASDWKNGTARDNWLDGFFGGVQLGWGNFGTYDNELYFDDVVASNERIGCDDSLTEPAPVLTPSFEITEESMVVTVDATASTGSDSFTYEWDFDGEYTDTVSGSNASYTFVTAGEKTITLTISSGNTSETLSKEITIVDSYYETLLTSMVDSTLKHCVDCHSPDKNRPIVFNSTDSADIEAGMIDYILGNSAQQLIDTPQGNNGSHVNLFLNASAEVVEDWQELVYLVEDKANGEADDDSGDPESPTGNIFISDDFEGQDADAVPAGWQTFLSYQIDMYNNNASNSTFALIDSSMAHSGSNSVRIKTGGNTIQPAFIFQDLPTDQDAFYSRAWMYIPTTLGGGIKGADGNHVHFMSYSTEMSGANKEELRYGTVQDAILGAFLPSSIDAGTENIVPDTEIPANEWVCVEFAMIKGETFDQATGWVNGIKIFDATQASDWARDPGQFFTDDPEIANHVTFGWRSFGDNKGVENIWFDDIVVSDQYIGCD